AIILAPSNNLLAGTVGRPIGPAASLPAKAGAIRSWLSLIVRISRFNRQAREEYYVAPAYPMLFAAGGAGFERIFALRFRWLKQAIAFLVVVSAVVLAAVVLPIL